MKSVQGKIYTMGKKMGEGTYGSVHQITTNDGHIFAFKSYPRGDDDQIDMGALREISILQMLKGYEDYGIIQLQDVIIQDDILGVVLPLYKLTLLDAIRKKILTPPEKLCIHQKLLRSLCFLHDNNIIHRDIKPENIMIDYGMNPILIDYTLSKIFNTDNTTETHTGNICSRSYRAPEVIKKESYGFPVDVWSLGVVLKEMYGLDNINLDEFGIQHLIDPNPITRTTPHNALYKYFRQVFKMLVPIPEGTIEVSDYILNICENFCIDNKITRRAAQYYCDNTKCDPHIAVMLACKFYETTPMDFSLLELDEEYNKQELHILSGMNYNLNVIKCDVL